MYFQAEVTEASGYSPGDFIPVGSRVIYYSAEDDYGNHAVPCSFAVVVRGRKNTFQKMDFIVNVLSHLLIRI